MSDVLKVGDTVSWSHAWGSEPYRPATVIGIEHTRGDKYGDPVSEAPWSEMKDREYTVDLDNGSWAYAYQLRPL